MAPTEMNHQSKSICVVPWCKNSLLNHSKDATFYKFPTDPVLRQLWLKLIGRPNMRMMSHSAVCSNHFKGGQLNSLNPVPTLFSDQYGNQVIRDPESEFLDDTYPEYISINVTPSHAHTIWRAIQELYKENKLFDIVIIAQGQYIPAHKIVLATMSPYIYYILSNKPSITCIILDLPKNVVKPLMEFFYTGELNFEVNLDNVDYVKQTSSLLCIEEVQWICNEVIRKTTKDKLNELPHSILIQKQEPEKMAVRLSEGIYHLLGNSKLCDLMLLIKPKVFHVHKLVLASLNSYFRYILTNQLSVTSICLNLSAIVFQSILNFFYTGQNQIQISKLNIFEVKKVADLLEIISLQNTCLEFLSTITETPDKLDPNFLKCLMTQETVEVIIEVYPLSETDFGIDDNCKNMVEKVLLTDNFIYFCSRCGFESENSQIVTQHMKSIHTFGTVIKMMNSKTSTDNELKILYNGTIKEITKCKELLNYDTEVLICVECGIMSKDFPSMRNHMNIIHYDLLKMEERFNYGNSLEIIFSRKICKLLCKSNGSYICKNCNLVLNKPNIIVHHVKRCNSYKEHCHLCDFSTHKKPPLLIHLFIKHNISLDNQKLEILRCQHCEYITWDRSILNNHLEDYTDDQKLVQCHICGQRFTNKDSLASHIRFHNNDKRFECIQCSYKCRTKHLLNQHIKCKHSNIRYLCPWCAYRSGLKGNIKIHVQRRHPEQLGSYASSSLQMIGSDDIDDEDEDECEDEHNFLNRIDKPLMQIEDNATNIEPEMMEMENENTLPESMLECLLEDEESHSVAEASFFT